METALVVITGLYAAVTVGLWASARASNRLAVEATALGVLPTVVVRCRIKYERGHRYLVASVESWSDEPVECRWVLHFGGATLPETSGHWPLLEARTEKKLGKKTSSVRVDSKQGERVNVLLSLRVATWGSSLGVAYRIRLTGGTELTVNGSPVRAAFVPLRLRSRTPILMDSGRRATLGIFDRLRQP